MGGLQELLGFKNARSWRYFIYLSVPWVLFCAYSLPSIDPSIFCGGVDGPWRAPLGACYWYAHPTITRYGIGVVLHLGSVLPAGILAVLQFTPSIRQRYRTLHKYVGYLAMALVMVGNIGGLMIMDKSFGGDVAVQSLVVVLATMTTYAGTKAVNEARHKRIASHRAWMLRTWSYLGAILTMRPLIPLTASIVSFLPVSEQWLAISCDEIIYYIRKKVEQDKGGVDYMAMTLAKWPACDPSVPSYSPDHRVAVHASFRGGTPIEAMAALRVGFGPMAWVGVMVHALAVEYYLNSMRHGSSGSKQRFLSSEPGVADERTKLLDETSVKERMLKSESRVLAASKASTIEGP